MAEATTHKDIRVLTQALSAGACGRLRFGISRQIAFDGNDAAVHANRKEAVPARGAPVSGKMEQTKQPCEWPAAVFPRDPLQVHVAAEPAMRIANVGNRNGPRIKALVAATASPGPKHGNANHVVFHTVPAGSPRAIAMAGWTQHRSSPWEGASREDTRSPAVVASVF